MINNNNKTTILLTSITLSLILLVPNTAFAALDPPGCAENLGNLAGEVTITPGKVILGDPADVFATYTVTLPDHDLPSCNAEINFFSMAFLTINGIDVTGNADCAAAGAVNAMGRAHNFVVLPTVSVKLFPFSSLR